MKKLLALLMLLGLVLGRGMDLSTVSASDEYTDISEVLPLR